MKTHSFTLVEILIVMALLLVVGGAVTINVRKAVIEQQYKTEVGLVVDTLRLAQDLMLIVGADIHFKLKAAPGATGLEYWLEADGGIPENWAPTMKRTHRILTAVRTASFKDQRSFPEIPGQLDIRFHSKGSLMSRGILRLSPYPNEIITGPLIQAICLPGYPHPLIAQSEEKATVSCGGENKESDSRLTDQTVKEILADVVKEEEQKTENPEAKPNTEQPRSETTKKT